MWTSCARRNGLANAPFPLPILCPADGVEPVEPGRLPDLGYVEGCCDAPGRPKVSIAAMLETGVCRWDHIPLGIYAARTRGRGHAPGVERMDAAWPEGEEHMAKLSVNAMIGLWARRADVIYSVRSSSCQLDGSGADHAKLLLRGGLRVQRSPIQLGFEHCMVAKTDCLLLQGLPKSRQESLEALTRLRQEECKPLLGCSAPPRMEAERPALRRWREVEDPLEHCAAGRAPGRRTLRARSSRRADGRPLGVQVRPQSKRAKT